MSGSTKWLVAVTTFIVVLAIGMAVTSPPSRVIYFGIALLCMGSMLFGGAVVWLLHRDERQRWDDVAYSLGRELQELRQAGSRILNAEKMMPVATVATADPEPEPEPDPPDTEYYALIRHRKTNKLHTRECGLVHGERENGTIVTVDKANFEELWPDSKKNLEALIETDSLEPCQRCKPLRG